VCARARARARVCERERELKRDKFWKINLLTHIIAIYRFLTCINRTSTKNSRKK